MTFSIVARDPATAELGVAVQSRYIAAGAAVPWAQPGVGVVATQAFTDLSYGPRGLALLRSGSDAQSTLNALLRDDADSASRQVAIVDAKGVAAVHTGERCVREAGSAMGEGVCTQGNMLERDSAWTAMLAGYRSAAGDFADRLLAALRAGESEGGDVRGRQSAALLVVSGSTDDQPWQRMVDLRVDDHPDPIGELARLLAIHRGFECFNRAIGYAAAYQLPEALAEFDRALTHAPADDQIAFGRALLLAGNGRVADARSELDRLRRTEPRWPIYLRRMAAAGMFPNDPSLMEAIAPMPATTST